MIIEVYGKPDCGLCKSANRKIAHLLQKWSLDGAVQVVFRDMETVDGAADGDFHDVFEIPSVLLKQGADQVLARWDGQAPPSDELRRRLSA